MWQGTKRIAGKCMKTMSPVSDPQILSLLMMNGFFVQNHGMTEKNRDLLKVNLSVFTIGRSTTENSSENFNSEPNFPKR